MLSENIRRYRKLLNLSQEELGQKLDRTGTAISYWESGQAEPSIQSIEQLAQVFNVPVQELLYGSPLQGKSAFLPVMATAHMGSFDTSDDVDRLVEVPESVAKNHPLGFVVRGYGDCMNRHIPDDAVIVVDPDMQPRNGKVVLVERNNELLIREYLRGSSTLVLSPDSFADYEDIIITAEDEGVRILGVVVWWQAAEDITYAP